MRRINLQNFISRAEYSRGLHEVIVPFDHTLSDIMVPGYWATVANNLRAGSIIEAHRADYSLDVTLRVVKVERGLAVVQPFPMVNVETEAMVDSLRADAAIAKAEAVVPVEPINPDYKIGHAPNGFFVQFKPSKETIAKGLTTKAQAMAAVKDHEKKSGVAAAA